MAPPGHAVYSNEMSLKKGNDYISDHLKRAWMLTLHLKALMYLILDSYFIYNMSKLTIHFAEDNKRKIILIKEAIDPTIGRLFLIHSLNSS